MFGKKKSVKKEKASDIQKGIHTGQTPSVANRTPPVVLSLLIKGQTVVEETVFIEGKQDQIST